MKSKKPLFFILMSVNLLPVSSFANEAMDAAAVSCDCTVLDSVSKCQVSASPNHLEGITFKSDECQKVENKDAFVCKSSALNFSDGSNLSDVTCGITSGKSKLAAEADANPAFVFINKLLTLIMGGEDSELKQTLSKQAASTKATVDAYQNRVNQNQAGVDAYLKASGAAPSDERNPASN